MTPPKAGNQAAPSRFDHVTPRRRRTQQHRERQQDREHGTADEDCQVQGINQEERYLSRVADRLSRTGVTLSPVAPAIDNVSLLNVGAPAYGSATW
jgi:hypothetical protein